MDKFNVCTQSRELVRQKEEQDFFSDVFIVVKLLKPILAFPYNNDDLKDCKLFLKLIVLSVQAWNGTGDPTFPCPPRRQFTFQAGKPGDGTGEVHVLELLYIKAYLYGCEKYVDIHCDIIKLDWFWLQVLF